MNNNIQRIRKARNMTQKELAAKLGCTDAAVSNYERATRGLEYELLLKISEALDCTVNDLVDQTLVFEPEQRMPISEEEKEVIEMFRKLNPINKDRVIAYMHFAFDSQRKK